MPLSILSINKHIYIHYAQIQRHINKSTQIKLKGMPGNQPYPANYTV